MLLGLSHGGGQNVDQNHRILSSKYPLCLFLASLPFSMCVFPLTRHSHMQLVFPYKFEWYGQVDMDKYTYLFAWLYQNLIHHQLIYRDEIQEACDMMRLRQCIMHACIPTKTFSTSSLNPVSMLACSIWPRLHSPTR